MSLNLQMVSLGVNADGKTFPPVESVHVKVADIEEASARCLAQIADGRIPRDRWAGGIITKEDGTEVAQVSHLGVVWKLRPKARDQYAVAFAPAGLATSWNLEALPDRRLDIEMPGYGTLSLGISDTDGPPYGFSLTTQDGFKVDNDDARIDVPLAIGADGVSVMAEDGELEWVENEHYVALDPELAESLSNTVKEWLSQEENAQALMRLVGEYALYDMDEARVRLSDMDFAFEEDRRAFLKTTLGVLAVSDAVEEIMAAASQPRP